MRPRFSTLAAFMLSTCLGLACASGPDSVSPFDPEDGEDLTVPAAPGGKDDGSGKACKVKESVAAYALHGTLILPTGAEAGYVLISGQTIQAVTTSKSALPAGTNIVETNGVISPGLMDLHNHVNYDFIPLWNSGKRWNNRYQWARAAAYSTAVKNPYNDVKNAKHACESGKYGEFRALTGGTTTIQGLSSNLTCYTSSWVRNVEYTNFCEDHVKQNVLAVSTIDQADAAQLNKEFTSGATKAFLIHLAEGIDDSSRAEFDDLRALDLIKPQVIAIHGTALTVAQLDEMGQAGMKLVWSPLSNLILYGQTTNIPAALDAGIMIAIGPDWSPSGSSNLLGELKVADRVNQTKFGGVITDEELWQMATSNPATMVGMGDELGSIKVGYYADLMVVRGDKTKPYRAVINAQPADVLLTTVGGAALYGDPTIIQSIGQTRTYDTVNACGENRVIADMDSTVASGTEGLAGVTQAFTKDGVTSTIPLFQCTPAPEWAFQ